MALSSLYSPPSTKLEKLEMRDAKYRFELKQDIHREDIGLPGVSDLSLGRENKNAEGMETTHHDIDAQVRPTRPR
uniref:Uncharacterized protein n=1 Tax=Candidatus Kentrum sp. SD TaxID=2126332 RepID=A0A450YJW9_9GAMM|nr:MAG: hypothetical protein BECKSD772F_GA0070984_11059 [Candidatus Kentron sp. SD]VFK47662.1 MAG: hypothetical protein BECKSD772E_GA0070983_11021 [Candidatus Kentron sp. SD]VFK80401.1 MAG: hypothetical protein BECKSD772D_GA0070982_11112 [Candidatus Kentron sp. SD]